MRRFLLLLAVVAVSIGVASFGVPQSAATVDGVVISQGTLDADLSTIAANSGFRCYLGAELALQGQDLPSYPGAGDTSGGPATSFNTQFADVWLSLLIENAFFDHLVVAEHIQVTKVYLAEGRISLHEEISSTLSDYESETGSSCPVTVTKILTGNRTSATVKTILPASFITTLVDGSANEDALEAHAAGYGLDTKTVSRYFDSHASTFAVMCVSDAEASTKTAATKIENEVSDGSTFAKVATAHSDGCAAREAIAAQFPTVSRLKAGGVSAPISETGEYVMFKATSVKPGTLSTSNMPETVVDAILKVGQTKLNPVLKASLSKDQITVNPQFGEEVGRYLSVAPPPVPPNGAALNPAANTPSASDSVGTGVSASGTSTTGGPTSNP